MLRNKRLLLKYSAYCLFINFRNKCTSLQLLPVLVNDIHSLVDLSVFRNSKKKQANKDKDMNLGSNPYLQSSYDIPSARRTSHESEMSGGSRGPSGPASPIISSPLHAPYYCPGAADGKKKKILFSVSVYKCIYFLLREK